MTKEELIQFLKENLSITKSTEYSYNDSPDSITLHLYLGEDEISTVYLT
jgi:hypothetical protein